MGKQPCMSMDSSSLHVWVLVLEPGSTEWRFQKPPGTCVFEARVAAGWPGWSCDSLFMWGTKETRAYLGFRVATPPLWLPWPADTGLKQETLKVSLEKIPNFPSPSSPARLSFEAERYLVNNGSFENSKKKFFWTWSLENQNKGQRTMGCCWEQRQAQRWTEGFLPERTAHQGVKPGTKKKKGERPSN